MANNFFVSFELAAPSQNRHQVEAAIKAQGSCAEVHETLWYLKSEAPVRDVARAVWDAMSGDDRLFVIDATNDTALWFNISDEVAKFLAAKWNA